MKIYKITSPNCDLVYVGKTIQTLNERFSGHHSGANRYAKGLSRYCSSFKVLEYGDAVIELIEETDDHRQERYWIEELNSCNQVKLNLVDISDPVSVAKYNREYRAANREAISERRSEKVACAHCGKMVSRRNIAKHKKSQRCINNSLGNSL